jgi:hypothetical protein
LLQGVAANASWRTPDGSRVIHGGKRRYLARSERFELPTPRFEVWCSIQLSYERLAVHHNAEVRKAVALPEVKSRLEAIGGDVGATSPAELRERVAGELAMWTRTVETAGIAKP